MIKPKKKVLVDINTNGFFQFGDVDKVAIIHSFI
jgi:hypothetical protein